MLVFYFFAAVVIWLGILSLRSGLDFAGSRSSIGAKVSDLMAAVGNATGMGALRDP